MNLCCIERIFGQKLHSIERGKNRDQSMYLHFGHANNIVETSEHGSYTSTVADFTVWLESAMWFIYRGCDFMFSDWGIEVDKIGDLLRGRTLIGVHVINTGLKRVELLFDGGVSLFAVQGGSKAVECAEMVVIFERGGRVFLFNVDDGCVEEED